MAPSRACHAASSAAGASEPGPTSWGDAQRRLDMLCNGSFVRRGAPAEVPRGSGCHAGGRRPAFLCAAPTVRRVQQRRRWLYPLWWGVGLLRGAIACSMRLGYAKCQVSGKG